MLLEIDFIKELRWQTFFHNFPFSQKYVLIRLALYHCQTRILQFCYITKGLLHISTGSLDVQVPGAVAKFSDLVIGYSLQPVGSRVS